MRQDVDRECRGRWPTVSGADRSWAQRKGAKRSSAVLCSIVKNPKKKGIVISIGRQPPIGFTLCSLNSSIVAVCCFCGLSLYFSLMAFSSRLDLLHPPAERDAARVRGRKTILRISVVQDDRQAPVGHEASGSRSSA